MRSQIIFNLLERLSARKNPGEDESSIVTWLCAVCEKLANYLLEGKGSIIIPKEFDKQIICDEKNDDSNLLRVQTRDHMWRWTNILTNLNLSKERYFDVKVLNGCLTLLANFFHFERVKHKYTVHQDELNLKQEEYKKSKKRKSQMSEVDKQFFKNVQNTNISELMTETKQKLKSYIPGIIPHLKNEQLQGPLLAILSSLCQNETEFNSLQHVAVYDYYFMMVQKIYTESNEMRKSLPYEKLFNLINLLNMVWSKFAEKQKKLWREYAVDHPDVLKMLYKISFKTVEEASQY